MPEVDHAPVDHASQPPQLAVSSTEAGGFAAPPTANVDDATRKAVEDVLSSDIGISTILNRLKQSIASVRDFSAFLKKRSSIAEDHAASLKKLSKVTHDSYVRSGNEGRSGTYSAAVQAMTGLQERIADNHQNFALSLHQMFEDLNELGNNIDRGRKEWKARGLAAESKVVSAETAAEKAKNKYDNLAEELDRVKTGDKTGRSFGLKGMKSGAQHEEELHRKLTAADQDYASKVQSAQTHRRELLQASRPQAVSALSELCKECDSALMAIMQKYAAFNEKLVLSDGTTISPLPEDNQRGLRDLIASVDNHRDFNNYVRGQSSKVPAHSGELEYRKHPTLLQATQLPQQRGPSGMTSPSGPPLGALNNGGPPGPFGSAGTPGPQGIQQQPTSPSVYSPGFHNSSHDQQYNSPNNRNSFQPQSAYPQAPPQDRALAGLQSQQAGYSHSPVSQAPPQLPPMSLSDPKHPSHIDPEALNDQPPAALYAQRQPSQPSLPLTGSSTVNKHSPSAFGVNLDELFRRDQSPVPMIVYQCIQAVDLFGLDMEGIYRIPGSGAMINKLRESFDSGASLDFRNPSTFNHDVNSVAGLLKQFLRELPDPLFTTEKYTEFIEAARIDDDIVRRDSLHALINNLPDPNYATLRAVILHLNRVQEHSERNRMSTQNLAICFAPTLLGPHTGAMTDAGFQARVVDTILTNTWQIFDED